MLGKTEGKKRRGWQRMRWLDNITDSMNMNLGDSEGQGCLACYSPWGRKESGITQRMKNKNGSAYIFKREICFFRINIQNRVCYLLSYDNNHSNWCGIISQFFLYCFVKVLHIFWVLTPCQINDMKTSLSIYRFLFDFVGGVLSYTRTWQFNEKHLFIFTFFAFVFILN